MGRFPTGLTEVWETLVTPAAAADHENLRQIHQPQSWASVNESCTDHSFEELLEGMVGGFKKPCGELEIPRGPDTKAAVQECLLSGCGAWDFDLFDLASKGSRPLGDVGMFTLWPLGTKLCLNQTAMASFIQDIEGRYHNHLPYHNSIHAADVVSSMAYMLGLRSSPLAKLPPIEQLAALIAAVGHDVGHDGRNNRFHTVTATALSQLYNDQSCLENLHRARFGVCVPPPWQNLRSGKRISWGKKPPTVLLFAPSRAGNCVAGIWFARKGWRQNSHHNWSPQDRVSSEALRHYLHRPADEGQ